MNTVRTRDIQLRLFFLVALVFGHERIIGDRGGGSKRSPFGAPDYIPATDSPHHTPVLERLGKCIGLGVTPYQFGSGTLF